MSKYFVLLGVCWIIISLLLGVIIIKTPFATAPSPQENVVVVNKQPTTVTKTPAIAIPDYIHEPNGNIATSVEIIDPAKTGAETSVEILPSN